jgi:hypothetical protein
MSIELVEVPGLKAHHQTRWRIRAMIVDGRDPVRVALLRWRRNYPAEYKAIMKVMRLAAQQDRVRSPKQVKKSGNPTHGNVYEMIAYTGIAQLMFFYDDADDALIICTNEHEKTGVIRMPPSSGVQHCGNFT